MKFLALLLFTAVFAQEPAAPMASVPPPSPTTEVAPAEPEAAPEAVPEVIPEAPPAAPTDTAMTVAPTEDVGGLLQDLVQATKDGKWGLVVALGLMLVVWGIRTFLWKSIKKEAIPYWTIGITTVTTFAGAVIAGTTIVNAILMALAGLMTALSAIGFWEVLGKKIFKKKTG